MAAPARHTAIDHLWIHESPRVDLLDRDMLRVFVEGEGGWLTDDRGDRYFDLCSSMWQAPLGHGRDDIAFDEDAQHVAVEQVDARTLVDP